MKCGNCDQEKHGDEERKEAKTLCEGKWIGWQRGRDVMDEKKEVGTEQNMK